MALSAEQIRIRRMHVTSTDIARLAGLDPYAGPLRVYLDKIGETEPEPPSSYGEAGSALEEPVARCAAERDGLVLENPGTILSEQHPIVAATPDRISLGTENHLVGWQEVVEIKTVWTPAAQAHYGEQDTDDVPLRHVCQTTWEMLATGLRRARLYAFFPAPGVPFAEAIRRYVISLDEEFAADLLDQALRFWRDHVEKRVPPPLDGSEEADAFLRQRYPRSQKAIVLPASPAVDAMASELSRLKADEEAAAERIAELENRIKAVIGHADGVETAEGLVTWRSSKARDSIDMGALALEPGVAALIAKHTKAGKPGEGPRVFRGPWSNRRK